MAGTTMNAGARTPEELETLFEDVLMMRDREALAALFEDGAALVAGDEPQAHGNAEIARLALATWEDDHTYVADPLCVVQARNTALIVTERGVSVARRGGDGAWRYAIVLQSVNCQSMMEPKGRTVTQDVSQAQTLKPVVVSRDEGEARWWFSSLAVIKTTAADTGGQMTIVEVTEPPGVEGPLHVHHREDEGFWILEGSATFEIGDTIVEGHAGDYLFGPRDIPHRYSVGDEGCRMLFLMTPGGFENLVIGMSEPAESRTLPPPSDKEPDWEHVAAVAKAHGAELLG